jgi:hypothetical protein
MIADLLFLLVTLFWVILTWTNWAKKNMTLEGKLDVSLIIFILTVLHLLS